MRAVPQSPDQSYNETVREYFTNYYAPSYLSHLMVYRDGIIQRLLVMPFVLFCWLYYLFCFVFLDATNMLIQEI